MQTVTEEYEQKQAIMAMYDPLGLLRYGAPELKRLHNRNLTIAFGISLAIHLLLIALLFIRSDEPEDSEPKLTQVVLQTLPTPMTQPPPVVHLDNEGSSGALHSKAPKGPAMRGDRKLTPDPFLQNRNHASPDETKPPKDMKPVAGTPVASNTDASHTQPSAPLDRDSLKNLRDHSSGGNVAGGAGGTGTHGIGGGGTGSVTDGLGTRGWAVRARANYPDGSNATGAVTLRFTVLPNGEITNVTPAKRADQSLVSAAIAGLKRARANPLPESVPQIPQQGWVTFTFTLKQ